MKEQEYKEKAGVIEAKIEAAQDELRDLQKKFIDEYRLKVGDKVKVTRRVWSMAKEDEYITHEVYVGCVHFKYSRLFIDFKKPKKDGSMSQQSAGIWYDSDMKIEKIN